MAAGLSLLNRPAAAISSASAAAKAKSVLVIMEQGGVSHIDTWDPKPEMPSDHRSPYKPIATVVPGMQFTSLLAKTAQVADKLAVVRSMYHKDGGVNGHPDGTQYTLSGEVPGGPVEMPDIGGVAAHRLGTRCSYLPPYIMVPGNHEQADATRQGFLPAGTRVFKTGGRDLSDPAWQVPNLDLLAGIDERRFASRQDLLSNLDVAVSPAGAAPSTGMEALREQAVDMLTNPATRSAFHLADEPEAVRTRYGRGTAGSATCSAAG